MGQLWYEKEFSDKLLGAKVSFTVEETPSGIQARSVQLI